MKYILFLLLTSLLSTAGELQTRTRVMMGTYVSIALPSKHHLLTSKTFDKLKKIESSLSSFDSDAILYKLNHRHTVPYDNTLASALRLSKSYYRDTDGYFDVTIGSITKELYHFGEEKRYTPPLNARKRAYRNIDGIHISQKEIHTDKRITIDLGGMGKGYAADIAATFLTEHNVSRGIIALSGDIRCLGKCTIALQSPFAEQVFALIRAKVPDLSISTSGTYRRFAAHRSEHHLIDPKTASQGKDFVSVSLFTRADNSKVDAYATAVSVMPEKKALKFLKNHKEIGFVLVDRYGKVHYGNLNKLIDLTWLPYKESATIPSNNKNREMNNTRATSLIHPDTTHPIEINR